MSKTFGKQLAAVVLIVSLYVSTLLVLKAYGYPGWTWRGFISDYKAIIALASFLAAPVGSAWYLYRSRALGESLKVFAARFLSGRKLDITLLAMSVGVSFSVLFLFLPRPSPLPEIDAHMEVHNWRHARDLLRQKKSLPIRRDIILSYESYLDSHSRSDGNRYENGGYHREQRAVVKRELQMDRGARHLNVLTYAELSKIIYYVEDRTVEELRRAIAFLLERIGESSRPHELALYTQKIADLYLAQREYDQALRYYEMVVPQSESQSAVINANIGNIYAATGKLEEAITRYGLAESAYPEGRRNVFYSNFGYLLMLSGRLDAAERSVSNALAINREDWYSYLNLALIYDRMDRYEDAISNYDIVLENESYHDFVKEARLLRAYSLIRSGGKEEDALAEILLSIGRSPTYASEISDDAQAKRRLYRDAAHALSNVNTYGIEEYIVFFENLSR